MLILPILVLFGLSSCRTDNDKILNDNFPVMVELVTEEIKEIELLCPGDLIFVDGYLMLINNCNEKLLQVVRMDDMQSGFFIGKGNGPSEFHSLQYSGHKQGDSLLLRTSHRTSAWVRPAKLLNNEPVDLQKISEPVQAGSLASNVFHFPWGWMRTDLMDQHLVVFQDAQGNPTRTVPYGPDLSYDIREEDAGYIYYSTSSYNASQQKFVTALWYFPYFFIYGKDEEPIAVRTQKDYQEPVFELQKTLPVSGTKTYYDHAKSSDKYIYLYKTNLSVGQPEEEAEPVVEIFDWQGNKVAKVGFDRKVGMMDFDFANGIIYGLSYCFEENRLFVVKAQVPDEFKEYFIN